MSPQGPLSRGAELVSGAYAKMRRSKVGASPSRTRRFDGGEESGVSALEYVLLVALVVMISVGVLLYLGRGGASPGHVANHVASNVVAGDNGGASSEGSVIQGTGSGAPVRCTSGQGVCADPMQLNGQTEVIRFWASGGVPPYTYSLEGQQQFMSLDATNREITIAPTCQNVGSYSLSLIVHDSARPTPNTGEMIFSLTVQKGSLC
jgi:hypothetical protein